MTASTLSRDASIKLVELPAPSLRIAALFAGEKGTELENVNILPGEGEDEVLLLAANRYRAVRVVAEGQCARRICINGYHLCRLFTRHKEAHHATITQIEDGRVSVRLFSEDLTTAQTVAWSSVEGVKIPAITPGDFQPGLKFNAGHLARTISQMQGDTVKVQPFPQGLIISSSGEGWKAQAFLAGVATADVDA